MDNQMTVSENLTFASVADEGDIEYYTTGSCHWLALALHRQLGWQMLVVADYSETYWQDPNDEGASLPSIVHVYAVSPEGEAWDIFGSRNLATVRDEAEERWHVGSYGYLIAANETALSEYVGCWGEDSDGDPIDRPLPEYSETDIVAATEIAARLFPHIMGVSASPIQS